MNDISVIHTKKGQLILVDSDKFEELNRFRWYIDTGGYASRNVNTNGTRRPIRMHKVLCNAKEVDHRSRHRWVNCSWNLRPATHAQNNANRMKQPGTSSRFKGVTWYKATSKWNAHIQVNKKSVFLGYYASERDAAIAYNGAALFHYGEFALLNEV